MRAYSNNNTILKESEFLENPDLHIKNTISRRSFLIILDDETMEERAIYHYQDLENK